MTDLIPPIIHVPVHTAVDTATIIIRHHGPSHPLSLAWQNALAPHGYQWRQDQKMFSRAV